MNEKINRVEKIKALSDALYNEYTEELFTSDDEKHSKLCVDVIRHEGGERFLLEDLQDIEVYFVKNTVKDLYNGLSLTGKQID
jgi:hypothetical protein